MTVGWYCEKWWWGHGPYRLFVFVYFYVSFIFNLGQLDRTAILLLVSVPAVWALVGVKGQKSTGQCRQNSVILIFNIRGL